MKLARYSADGAAPRIGVVQGDRLIDAGVEVTMRDLIGAWDQTKAQVEARCAGARGRPLSEVRLLAPIARPGKIFAIGLNYADHIAESGAETPKDQVWFAKAPTAVNGPFAPVQLPKVADTVDYEVEMVVVIGAGGRHIPRESALDHVFGFCVGNDVTERSWQHRTGQWTLGKSFDTHAPFGPWITTRDEVGDPHALALSCTVNGEIRQESNTRQLVFNVLDQLAYLSQAMTLEPGDLIFTGTPGGVGAAMTPRRFLTAGDVVRCEIEGLGFIENRFEPEV
jgi:2-keto-4-pentenoate hydratase/2-oxohepta-3-ene-1,7-dioic acid hydratase in catechol pathway